MDHERAFQEAIQEQPDDDLHRLARADWLDDHGQSDRAAFVRAQLRFASLAEEDLARDAAEDEADDLLAVHEAEWAGRVGELAVEWQWRRGCIEHVTVRADALLNHGAELFSLAPIRSIRLLGEADDLARLAGCPFLQYVESLDVSGPMWSTSFYKGTYHRDGALARLLTSPHLTRLTRLEARGQGIEGPLIQTLIDARLLSRLVALDLSGNIPLGDRAVRLLAGASAPRLETLGLEGTNVTLTGMRALLNARGLPRWRELKFNQISTSLQEAGLLSRLTSLTDPGFMGLPDFEELLRSLRPGQVRQLRATPGMSFTREHVQALTNSPNLTGLRDLQLSLRLGDSDARLLAGATNFVRLTSLDLSGNVIGGPGIRALVNSPNLPCLRELNLAGNFIGTTNTEVIAASVRASRLTSLDLGNANLDAESGRILAEAPALSRLRVLRLGNNRLGDEGVKALANSPHLCRLRELDLDSNDIDSSGADALLLSPHFKRLVRLNLRNALISVREREQLRQRFGPGVTF